MRPKGLTLSIKDLRLAKFGKGRRIAPCTAEFDAYLAALARVKGDGGDVPLSVRKALDLCMQGARQVGGARKAGIAYHLSKFVAR